jgi:hypothetical protein
MERDIRLQGHLIDDFILSRVLDVIGSLGASHEIRSLTIGHFRHDPSTAVIRIVAPNLQVLTEVLRRVSELGAVPIEPVPARLEPAPADGVLPEHFHATSNLPTEVLVNDQWLPVAGEEMDLAVVAAADRGSVRAVPMAECGLVTGCGGAEGCGSSRRPAMPIRGLASWPARCRRRTEGCCSGGHPAPGQGRR